MIIEAEFKFLKFEQRERKAKEGEKLNNPYFYVINLLDEDNNPCNFFVFDKEVMSKVVEVLKNIKGLQEILVKFELNFVNNNWNVKLLDIQSEY